MHSQLALTEHGSLNLAPLILLDPVRDGGGRQSGRDGGPIMHPSRGQNLDIDRKRKIRGRSQMTSAEFSGFWTHSPPLVSILGQSIVLISRNLPYCIRIWVTPSLPLSADVICERPLNAWLL